MTEKFSTFGLTPVGSLTVKAPRALECPVQMEAVLEDVHSLADGTRPGGGGAWRCWWRSGKYMQRPRSWRTALIMSFQNFHGLTPGKVHGSELAKILEAAYRA